MEVTVKGRGMHSERARKRIPFAETQVSDFRGALAVCTHRLLWIPRRVTCQFMSLCRAAVPGPLRCLIAAGGGTVGAL